MQTEGTTGTVTVSVPGAGAGTAVALTATAPDRTSSSPAATAGDAGTWSAEITWSMPGVWYLAWTVTGAGAGTIRQAVTVTAAPAPPTGRQYATTADLAKKLNPLPADADEQLVKATAKLDDDLLLTAWYEVDDDGMPTDPDVVDVLRRATVALVCWWGETGDSSGAGALYQSASIGSVALGRSTAGGGNGGSPTASLVSSEVTEILAGANLFTRPPWSY